MPKHNKKPKKSRSQPGSLLAPEATGGIIAGRGFDFQTRYAACYVPVWLLKEAFQHLLFEGTGDIDAHYTEAGKDTRLHIQVKDHEVTATELKSVLQQFVKTDTDHADTYRCFTIVCPSVAAALRPVVNGLVRLRGAAEFFKDKPHALAPTREEVNERLRMAGLGDYIEFIHSKVYFEVDHGDMHHDDRAINHFIGHLLQHPEYASKLRAMVQPAFAEMMRAISAKKGVTLSRADIETLLRAAVTAGIASEKKITLWLQNWTSEIFDPPADYALDWSACFDRQTRRVPSPDTWNNDLIPQLEVIKKKILKDRKERLIRFRGKCALSSGIALGAMFPTVGGWTFEIPQPPAKEDWRSDAPPATPYELQEEILEGSPQSTDIVLGLNIRGDGRQDVFNYIERTGNPPRIFAFMSPSSPGAQSIGGAGEAVAFVQAARERLGQLLKKLGLRRTRIFFYGPFALAVFLGQQLTSVGEIELFEYQDPGYVLTCSLKT
jgi:hypothetical protein